MNGILNKEIIQNNLCADSGVMKPSSEGCGNSSVRKLNPHAIKKDLIFPISVIFRSIPQRGLILACGNS